MENDVSVPSVDAVKMAIVILTTFIHRADANEKAEVLGHGLMLAYDASILSPDKQGQPDSEHRVIWFGNMCLIQTIIRALKDYPQRATVFKIPKSHRNK